MRIVVAGGTGFVGSALVGALVVRGEDVVVLTRRPERARLPDPARAVRFDAHRRLDPAVLDGTDAVVNLVGENVAGLWTDSKKRAIRESRVGSTHELVRAIRGCERPPAVLVNASAVGYYGDRGDELLDESATSGDDFLARVCVEWEKEARAAVSASTRVAIVRQAIVLGKGGVLGAITPFFRCGLGGPLGSGRQWLPWIHLDDDVGLFLMVIDRPEVRGAINAAGPAPATNAEFTKALGKALRRPAVIPAPAFALKIVLGELGRSILASQRVVPTRANELGYRFQHENVQQALLNVFAANRS